jgi:aspartyl-tRNA(Asn)/glutamyl-tRNA(Gln) amidotransferase subunit A
MVGNRSSAIANYSIKRLSEGIKTGKILPTELVEVSVERIKEMNPSLNAFITVIREEELYKEAQIAENEIRLGKYRGPFHGIPFSVKDIIYVSGIRCTAGSKIMQDFVPMSTATVVGRLKKAGGILIGTNNLNEFASGITGINPFYGTSKNPWCASRISGGSSGGSAVAVASGMAFLSIGTDTGGSVRVPASLCGVVGLKPTFGSISMDNIFPLAPTLDHVGCITRSVWDAAAFMEFVTGWNTSNGNSANRSIPSYTKLIEQHRTKMFRIAVLKRYFCDNLHPEIDNIFFKFIEFLRSVKNVLVLEDFDLHNTEKYYSSWRNVRLAEATSVHLEWLNTKADDYSPEVKEMLLQGTRISAVDYIQSLIEANEIRNEMLALFSNREIDVLIVPTTIVAAPRITDTVVSIRRNDVLETRQALLRNTIVFNSTGLPAITIPIGFTNQNLPVGVQIVGPPFGEETILSIAYFYEQINNKSNNSSLTNCASEL